MNYVAKNDIATKYKTLDFRTRKKNVFRHIKEKEYYK